MKTPLLSQSVNRRNVLKAAAVAPVAAKLGAPALISAQGGPEISHMVYSSLPLDKDTLTRVPPDQTENIIEYFQWSVDEFKKVEPDIEVKLEYLPHDESWFAKIDSSLVAGSPARCRPGTSLRAAKYIPLGALSPINELPDRRRRADLVAAVPRNRASTARTTSGRGAFLRWRHSDQRRPSGSQHGAGDLLPNGETRRWLMDDALEAFKSTTVDTDGDGSIDTYGTVLITDIHYHVTQFLFGFGARLFNEDETESHPQQPGRRGRPPVAGRPGEGAQGRRPRLRRCARPPRRPALPRAQGSQLPFPGSRCPPRSLDGDPRLQVVLGPAAERRRRRTGRDDQHPRPLRLPAGRHRPHRRRPQVVPVPDPARGPGPLARSVRHAARRASRSGAR